MFNLVLDNIVGKREIELNKMSSFIARTVPHCKKKKEEKSPHNTVNTSTSKTHTQKKRHHRLYRCDMIKIRLCCCWYT